MYFDVRHEILSPEYFLSRNEISRTIKNFTLESDVNLIVRKKIDHFSLSMSSILNEKKLKKGRVIRGSTKS